MSDKNNHRLMKRKGQWQESTDAGKRLKKQRWILFSESLKATKSITVEAACAVGCSHDHYHGI
jgi:CTP-dependent riboflavin kinase